MSSKKNSEFARECLIILAEEVAGFRRCLGMSQVEFAERSMVSRMSLCRLESGRHLPAAPFFAALYRAHGEEILDAYTDYVRALSCDPGLGKEDE